MKHFVSSYVSPLPQLYAKRPELSSAKGRAKTLRTHPHSAVQNSAHLSSWRHVCWWWPYRVPTASLSTQKPARWLQSERDTERACGDLLVPGRFSQTWIFGRLELLSGWRVQLVPINQINPLGAKDSAPSSNMDFFPHTQPFSVTPAGCRPIRLNSDPVSLEMASDPTGYGLCVPAVLPARWLFIPFLTCAQGALLSGGVIDSWAHVCLRLCVSVHVWAHELPSRSLLLLCPLTLTQ